METKYYSIRAACAGTFLCYVSYLSRGIGNVAEDREGEQRRGDDTPTATTAPPFGTPAAQPALGAHSAPAGSWCGLPLGFFDFLKPFGVEELVSVTALRVARRASAYAAAIAASIADELVAATAAQAVVDAVDGVWNGSFLFVRIGALGVARRASADAAAIAASMA